MNLTALAASLTAALLFTSAQPAHATTTPSGTGWDRTTTEWSPIATGHVDAPEISFADGKLTLGISTHQEGQEHDADPATTYLHLVDSPQGGNAKLTIPEGDLGTKLRFLGEPGTTVWNSPQIKPTNNAPVWVGYASHMNTQHIKEGTLTLALTHAEGPGRMEAFTIHTRTKSVNRLWSSTDPAYNTVKLATHVHGHCNWAFTHPGTYRLTFQASGTTPQGTNVTSAPMTVVWHVGPGSPR